MLFRSVKIIPLTSAIITCLCAINLSIVFCSTAEPKCYRDRAFISSSVSLKFIEGLVHPLQYGTFLIDFFERNPLVMRRGKSKYYSGMFDSAKIDDVIIKGKSMADIGSRLIFGQDWKLIKRYMKDGEYWSAALNSANISVSEAKIAFQAGYSLLIPQLQRHWAAVHLASSYIEEAIGYRVNVNLYMSPLNAQAFETHFDWMDGLILQIEGKKDWIVYDPNEVYYPRPDNMRKPSLTKVAVERRNVTVEAGVGGGGGGECKDAPMKYEVQRFTLSAGDIAYIPRGVLHEASTAFGAVTDSRSNSYEDGHDHDNSNGNVDDGTRDKTRKWRNGSGMGRQDGGEERGRRGGADGGEGRNAGKEEEKGGESPLSLHLTMGIEVATHYSMEILMHHVIDTAYSTASTYRTSLSPSVSPEQGFATSTLRLNSERRGEIPSGYGDWILRDLLHLYLSYAADPGTGLRCFQLSQSNGNGTEERGGWRRGTDSCGVMGPIDGPIEQRSNASGDCEHNIPGVRDHRNSRSPSANLPGSQDSVLDGSLLLRRAVAVTSLTVEIPLLSPLRSWVDCIQYLTGLSVTLHREGRLFLEVLEYAGKKNMMRVRLPATVLLREGRMSEPTVENDNHSCRESSSVLVGAHRPKSLIMSADDNLLYLDRFFSASISAVNNPSGSGMGKDRGDVGRGKKTRRTPGDAPHDSTAAGTDEKKGDEDHRGDRWWWFELDLRGCDHVIPVDEWRKILVTIRRGEPAEKENSKRKGKSAGLGSENGSGLDDGELGEEFPGQGSGEETVREKSYDVEGLVDLLFQYRDRCRIQLSWNGQRMAHPDGRYNDMEEGRVGDQRRDLEGVGRCGGVGRTSVKEDVCGRVDVDDALLQAIRTTFRGQGRSEYKDESAGDGDEKSDSHAVEAGVGERQGGGGRSEELEKTASFEGLFCPAWGSFLEDIKRERIARQETTVKYLKAAGQTPKYFWNPNLPI